MKTDSSKPESASTSNSSPQYGRVQTAKELGMLVRMERKRQNLTLARFYESSGISTRYMSEFERGKPSAERILETLHMLGLEVLVVPRKEVANISTYSHRRPDDE